MLRARSAWAETMGLACVLASAVWSCGDPERAPYATPPRPPTAAPDAGVGIDVPVSNEPPNCGGERIRALLDLPKFYFVLDRSGSMNAPIDRTGLSKYKAAYRSVGALLRAIGHRVEYGAAVFPGRDQSLECDGGRQIFAMSAGDSLELGGPDRNGPKLHDLLQRLSALAPAGGTPTSAALAGLRPLLQALGGRTYVVLATDGAPNCNAAVRCETGQCIPDIEQQSFDGKLCGASFSCCNEERIGEGASVNCIDASGTLEQVSALREAGISTYVVGMPGSEAYATLLAALAREGGTARAVEPAYYAISDAVALQEALFAIGTGVPIGCDVTLASLPQDPELVNVHFDGALVQYDPDNGWDWRSPSELTLRGAACEKLSSGAVLELQITHGCRTVVR